jgi:ABC-type transport system involved in multi-copper enzyme maturation permease subunit
MSSSTVSNSLFSRILSIARNTFREAIRDRVLYNLVIFVLLITASAILLGELTDGQEARTIVNIGLNAVLLFGTFIAIFVGVGLVSKELEKKTVYAMFAKPVRRTEFIVGKFLGLCATLFINTTIMVVGITLALLYVGGTELIGPVWTSALLIFLELTITTAIAILFSSFSSPALSALMTFLVFLIGHLTASLRDLGKTMESVVASGVLEGLYYLLPNLSLFSFRSESAIGMMPTGSMMIGAAGYAIAYATVILAIASAVFARRNFK